jgi:hypothetical protein
MTTTTKKKPPAKKEKKQTPSGTAKIAGTNDDPNQTYLDGTEPETVPAIDAKVARYSDLTRSRQSAKEAADDELDEIAGLMKEHGLTSYRTNGKIVTVVEGQTVCKIKKASNK